MCAAGGSICAIRCIYDNENQQINVKHIHFNAYIVTLLSINSIGCHNKFSTVHSHQIGYCVMHVIYISKIAVISHLI